MHCDGARMWEVLAKTGMELEEACRPFDTVSLCMSKGLGAPIGSLVSLPSFLTSSTIVLIPMNDCRVLVGPKALIEKAKWFRKLFGGGIRQCGSLSLAASYSLTHHLPLLSSTHTLATHLATSLAALGVRILLPVETNMLWLDPTPLGFTIDELVVAARARGIRLGGTRIVIHIQIPAQVIEELIEIVKELKEMHAGDVVLTGEGEENYVDREENDRFAKGDWSSMTGYRKTKRLGAALYGKK